MLPKSVSLWTIKDPSLTCAWNALHLHKIIINVKYSSSVWCSSGQDRCRALMERPDTCHVPSQTTSGREKTKTNSRYHQILSKSICPVSTKIGQRKNKNYFIALEIIRYYQTSIWQVSCPASSNIRKEKKNNMMIKSVHLGVPLCGKHSRNNFFPTLPFFKFEINRNTKSPLLNLISSDRWCHYWPALPFN